MNIAVIAVSRYHRNMIFVAKHILKVIKFNDQIFKFVSLVANIKSKMVAKEPHQKPEDSFI